MRKRDVKGCVAVKEGQRIDFLGYQFVSRNVLLRKSIKQNFARKAATVEDKDKRNRVLASYWGWCKWGNCRNLWNKVTNNDMSFLKRGITSQTTTKDGKRFFDDPEKKMMEILNIPITILDFEGGLKTKNGNDRYAIRFDMSGTRYKVITNSFTLKSVLDQSREYDNKLREIREKVQNAKSKFGSAFSIDKLGFTEDELSIYETDTPILPQQTIIRRRELGGGKYDFYFE